MKTYKITQRLTAAFSLVEVTLALGVAGFCLIAILGLLPAGVNTNQNSVQQTTANGILSSIVADLRATPATSSRSNLFQISVGGGDSSSTKLYFAGNGTYTTSPGANTIFMATVTFLRTGGGDDGEEGSGGSGTESFDVKITWPYRAASGGGDGEEGGGSSQTTTPGGIAETFVALDRNRAGSSGEAGGSD